MALFRNDSPGALTMEQAIARHTAYLEKERRRIEAAQRTKAEAKTRAKKAAMAEQLAAEGRGHDTEVAHVTPGEMVIPHLFQTPEVLAALSKVADAHGVPLGRFRIGDARNSINPRTGAPEFIFDDSWHGAIPSVVNANDIAHRPMFSGNPWSSLTTGFDQWAASTPINIDYTRTGLDGAGSIPAGTEPYRYEGRRPKKSASSAAFATVKF